MFCSNRAAVRQFLAQGGGGAIVNIGSVLSSHPSARHFSTHAYAAAKCAVEEFSRSVAARYAPDNIRVNVAAAGLTDTPMARAMQDKAIHAFVATKQPLDGGSAVRHDDIGDAVAFLLSEHAFRYRSGVWHRWRLVAERRTVSISGRGNSVTDGGTDAVRQTQGPEA